MYTQISLFDFKSRLQKVEDAIKKVKKPFAITNNGILAICNEENICFGNNDPEEILNMEVNKIETISNGQFKEITAIRVS